MVTLPFWSIRQAWELLTNDIIPAPQCHSLIEVNPIPCIRPLGRRRAAGGCHFRPQSIASFPISTTSLRLCRRGKPFSSWYRVMKSQSFPWQPSFRRATSVGSRPNSAATRSNITLWGTQAAAPCRKHSWNPLLVSGQVWDPRMLGILVHS